MRLHEVSVRIDAPAEVVWQTMVAVHDWPQWTPTMTSVRRLDDGPFEVGSSARIEQPGQSTRVWTVTDLQPGFSFHWSAGNALAKAVAGHFVSQEPQGCLARLTIDATGPLARLVALLTGRTIREMVDTEARSLKQWCERLATDQPS